MWVDDLDPGKSWASLWTGYVLCGHCRGIRQLDRDCPVCQDPSPSLEPQTVVLSHSAEIQVCPTFAGAEGRYEDYLYLQMLEREWKRPVLETDSALYGGAGRSPSPRAAIVLLYWTYFETRMERLLRAGMEGTPASLVEDALDRYASIGARMDRLYRVVFGTTYGADLAEVGQATVWNYLCQLQKQRNAFIHGDPGAIDDALVTQVVQELKNEHEAWIAVFNKHRSKVL